jgi:hypothetical protein
MTHAYKKSTITIVVRNPQGVIVKNETFSLDRVDELEPTIGKVIAFGSKPPKALARRRPIQRMSRARAK